MASVILGQFLLDQQRAGLEGQVDDLLPQALVNNGRR